MLKKITDVEGLERLAYELGIFLLNGSGNVVVNAQIERIGGTDLSESEGSADFSVYGTLDDGNRFNLLGNRTSERDKSWLKLKVGDKITFGYSKTRDESWTPPRTATGGGGDTIHYKSYQGIQLLNVVKGNAREAFSQLADDEEMALKKPKAKSGAPGGQFAEDVAGAEGGDKAAAAPAEAL